MRKLNLIFSNTNEIYYTDNDNVYVKHNHHKFTINGKQISLKKLTFTNNICNECDNLFYNDEIGYIKLIKPSLTQDGYLAYRLLTNDGSKISIRQHQLVVYSREPKIEGLVIDHIDRNRTNNAYENLRQCSIIENNNNRILSDANIKHLENLHKSMRIEIYLYDKDYNLIHSGKIQDIANYIDKTYQQVKDKLRQRSYGKIYLNKYYILKESVETMGVCREAQ